MPSTTDRCPTLCWRSPLSGYIQPSTITSVATVTEYICHLPRMSHTQSINPQKQSSWLKDMIWAFLILIVTAKTLRRDDWLWQFMSLLPMLELLSFKKVFATFPVNILSFHDSDLYKSCYKQDWQSFNMLKGHSYFLFEPKCSSFAILFQYFLFKETPLPRNKTRI